MDIPEKLSIRYNAAEAVEDFLSLGRILYPMSNVDPDDLLDAMGLYIDRSGVFPVKRLDTGEDLTVKPLERVGHAIILSCWLGQETFALPYTIADDPAPRSTYHVDILAELHLTSNLGDEIA